MPPETTRVAALRRLLDERWTGSPVRSRRVVPTGVPQIDELLEGGLGTGTLTEFVSVVPSGGAQLALGSLLLAARVARRRIALLDASGAFALDGLDDDAVAHVVWVRCPTLAVCWRAADLAARDPNYSVVVLELRGVPVAELQRTRSSVWVRLQRAVEETDTALLVQTTRAVVPNARARISFAQPLDPACLTAPRSVVLRGVAVEWQRLRSAREAVG